MIDAMHITRAKLVIRLLILSCNRAQEFCVAHDLWNFILAGIEWGNRHRLDPMYRYILILLKSKSS